VEITHADSDSDVILNQKEKITYNEDQVKVQIIKDEHMRREARANEIHNLMIDHMKEKHSIEMKIKLLEYRILEERLCKAKNEID
jgi:hypothetical protein